ncbi:MAG TPA: ABC transporter permease [Gemmatimonadaceae bacterium]|nr:ABC transporter permease [Gemmatimonadaceae bacterium]
MRLVHDLRQSFRTLAKAPLFTAIATVSLGLALALNTTMFALADSVLHPLVPYPNADRLVIPAFRGGDFKHPVPADVQFRAIRDGAHSFSAIAAYWGVTGLVQTANVAEDGVAIAVSPEFFDLFGVRPFIGRAFDASDFRSNGAPGAIISFRLWNRLFAGRPLSDGLTFHVGLERYAVIGVMPRGVHPPISYSDIWLPEDAVPRDSTIRHSGPAVVMRLKPGVSLDAARAELAVVAARLTAEFTPKRPLSAWLNPVVAFFYVPRTVFPSFILGTVIMVLVIACANLGTMMIARGMARRRETAIRVALGAGGRDVARGVFAECAVIVAAGVLLGIVLTFWALYVLPHFAIPWVPELGDLDPTPSWRVFAFALAASVATIVVAGAAPALRAARTDPAEPMKEAGGTTTGRIRDRYNPLIVLEVALSTALLMCSGLFVLIAIKLASFDFRYDAKHLVVADIPIFRSHETGATVARFFDDVVARARALQNAVASATHYWAPVDGPTVAAEQGKSGDTWMNLRYYQAVSPDFLRTFGVRVVRGRDFAPGDGVGAAPVVIVDEEAATRLWPDTKNPVGRMIRLGNRRSTPWLHVIGVAEAVELFPRRDYFLPPEPTIYVVAPNDSARSRQLVVRVDARNGIAGRTALALALRRELQVAIPWTSGIQVHPWLDDYEGRRAASTFAASLFGAFAAFGLVLCAVGLYGVLAYAVSRRLREFAVRVALGARRRDVARLVVHDAAVTALAGVAIGAFVALWVTRSLMDDVVMIDYAHAIALIAAEAILFAVAFVAALGPVREAAKADPVEILRAT